MTDVGIGLIGYGDMGKAHAYGYRVAPLIRELPVTPRLRVISGRDAAAVARAAGRYGVEEWVTDWRAVLERDDVQIVDVCTPPGTHAEIVRAAAAAGKAVVCEKPLSVSLEDGRAAVAAAGGVLNAIGFNYRRLPALSLMQRLIAEGRIGAVRLWRATWLSDEFVDPAIPFDWRFDAALGGSTIADLGAHLLDLALWMVGDVETVVAQSRTFVTERSGRSVEIDEASSGLLRFASGATGTLEVARTCPQRPCDFTVEASGEAGTLRFDYARLNELWLGEGGGEYGLQRIRAEHPSHPQTAGWWPIGQGIGYGASFANQAADHLARWPDGPWEPDLAQGLRVQRVTDALERSAASGAWVSV